MDGYQIKLSLVDLKATLKSDKALKALIEKELVALAEKLYISPKITLLMVDEVFEKARTETSKFKDADMGLGVDPYPRAACNNLSIQITPPTKGKVGVHEWNSIVCV
jgi:hypothetical protein